MANKPFTPTTAAASGLVHMVLPGTSSGPSAEDRCVYPGCSQNKKTAPTTPAPLPTWQGSKGQTSPQNCLHHEQPGMSGMPAHGQHAQSCSTIDAQEHAVGRPGEAAAGRSLEAGTGSASTPQQAAHIAAQHGNSVSSTSCHTHLVQASTTPAAHAPSVTAAALRGSLDRSGSGRGLSAGMCFEDAGTARTAPPAKRPKR